MIQPPSPPQKANEYLTELAQYYRELIEYHQQAAIRKADLALPARRRPTTWPCRSFARKRCRVAYSTSEIVVSG